MNRDDARQVVIDAIIDKLPKGLELYDERLRFNQLDLDDLDVISIMLEIQSDKHILLFDSSHYAPNSIDDMITLVEEAPAYER